MKNFLLFLFAVATFIFSKTSSANPSGNDAAITDVQEFTVDGINVLLRESKEAPVVTAVLYIKGGTSTCLPPNLLRQNILPCQLFPEAVQRSRSKQRYRRVILRMGSGIGGSDGRDYSVLEMRSTREHFDTTWKFFSEIIAHPTIDNVEFNNLQRNALVGYQGRRDDPEFVSRTVLDSIYFLGHPYGRRTTKEDLEAETASHVLSYYKSIMVKSRMLLVVVGNISRTELEKK